MNQHGHPIARLSNVTLTYRNKRALDAVTLDIPSGCMVGLIGSDGVGKSSLLGLIAGARRIQSGRIEVLDGDMADTAHRNDVCARIAYMPQGLGKNLYPDLSVRENIEFFGRLFGLSRAERRRRIADLLESTGLAPFPDRPARKLSGGMRQKLGLCCALIHDPDLLILDEPTTGVDPLSRRQFWDLIGRMRARHPGMSVIIATAYMEEAERFDRLIAMHAGKILAAGTPQEFKASTRTTSLENAFAALLPGQRREQASTAIPSRVPDHREITIRARDLTCRFGDFTAVDRVCFEIVRGEIFGFLGPNGCGKTTTMKMLTGLLPATEGEAFLLGNPIDAADLSSRYRVGYMSQSFSLYMELTVQQNLALHARLFQLPPLKAKSRIDELVRDFGLDRYLDQLASQLPLGIRQRLSLAVAIVHEPEMLILDEPTSGVDPLARDEFWQILLDLSRNRNVTIFVSTHFMNEAARCDRIALMNDGRVLATDTPEGLIRARGAINLEEAFISYLEEASGRQLIIPDGEQIDAATADDRPEAPAPSKARRKWFSLRRMLAYTTRETLELIRDPIRLSFALLGTAFLMIIFGFGITTDVDNLSFAVLDRDQTPESRAYVGEIRSSRYFIEKAPLHDDAELERRLKSSDVKATIEIAPGFGRDIKRGTPVSVGAWVDGAMPFRAETIRGYLQGVHAQYLSDPAINKTGDGSGRGNDRDPVPLQSGFQERLQHGAGNHGNASGPDPGHPDGAGDRPGKGTWFDYEFLCHAGDPDRIPCRQANSVHRPGVRQLLHTTRDDAAGFQRPAEGQCCNAGTGRGSLCGDIDRLWHADLVVCANTNRGTVRHGHPYGHTRDPVRRHADAGVVPVRGGRLHRKDLPDDLFPSGSVSVPSPRGSDSRTSRSIWLRSRLSFRY